MSDRRYQKTLQFLYRQLPMFQRVGPVAFKKDLTNALALMDHLGQPHTHFPSIHIAGTNGKGSTAHMLAASLQAGGRKVGLYTSPHYRDFRERIKINGDYISETYVTDFVDRHKDFFMGLQPSFFEITVAMAFDYFAGEQVDIAVIETGLGGRLDSTNIITPLLSVITNISYDHQQFLGDTLPLIAGEKAGIIKAGVAVVIGETQPETKPVFDQKAAEMRAPVVYADQHYRAEVQEATLGAMTLDVYRNGELHFPGLELGFSGPFQQRNLQTVLQALELLPEPFSVTEEELRRGLRDLVPLTRFMGRWQKLGERPTILCDSAHNEGGLRVVMNRLKELPCDRLHMVIGTVSDKSLDGLLVEMPGTATYYFCKPDVPRGLKAEELREKAAQFGLTGEVYPSVADALAAARKAAAPEDLIFVGGSTFVVAEVV